MSSKLGSFLLDTLCMPLPASLFRFNMSTVKAILSPRRDYLILDTPERGNLIERGAY